MIHVSEALNILNDGQKHNIVFVSKGKGTLTPMNDVVVLSSNYERKKFNVKSEISKQIRWVYYLLLISVDDEEIYI